MNKYSTDDIIFALATAWATGAIAVVRVSGEGCIREVSKVSKCKGGLESYPSNSAVFCHFAKLDDVVITVFKDGHGYTGEESLEISCHGGLEVVKSILAKLESMGFRKANRGEFTLRAFIHGKVDLTRAEAVNELINSQGREGHIMALNRLGGALYKRINEIKNLVLKAMGTIEVQLDYAEDEIDADLDFPSKEIDEALDMIGTISATYSTGRLYSQGARIVLCGSTNAGKSSLFNYFLKEERAIVSDIAGTTRDFIEAKATIDGIPVRLYDTAGLRESGDVIEEEGIRRSHSLVEGADIILYLSDSSSKEVLDKSLIEDKRTILVSTKADLSKEKTKGVSISVVTGEGFDLLVSEISKRLKDGLNCPDDSSLVIESERQKVSLERAKQALECAKMGSEANLPLDIVTADVQEALEALGEITGEVTTDDILDNIFANFCVGK